MRGASVLVGLTGIFLLTPVAAFAQAADPGLSFEVAAIREGPPRAPVTVSDGCEGGPGTPDSGRLTCYISLYGLIVRAYNLKKYQFPLPSGLATRFGIDAVVPPGATKEQVQAMERNLLAERFLLASHFEKNEREIFVMTVGARGVKFKEWVEEAPIALEDRPKRGDPVKSAKMWFPPDPSVILIDGSDVYGNHALKARMSMAKFAEALSGRLFLDRPVIDSTGLTGVYSIMVDWVAPLEQGRGTAAKVPDDPQSMAVGPSLVEAIQGQLGVKLESKKGVIDMFVIDHIEKTPTAN